MADPHDFHIPKGSYTKEDLLQSGRGGYFGPGNAQLPALPMLMMDRITEISLDGGEFGKGHVVAELDIAPDLWFFGCHFVGRSGDAGVPRPRRHVAERRVLARQVWLAGQGTRCGCGRSQIPRRCHPQ